MSHDCVNHVTEIYDIPKCCTKIASAQVQNKNIVQSLLPRSIHRDLWYIESAEGRFNFYSLRKHFTRNSTYQHKKGYFPCLIAIYTKMDKLHTIPQQNSVRRHTSLLDSRKISSIYPRLSLVPVQYKHDS